jgi:type I restriction-modification system DNA methylase subunit
MRRALIDLFKVLDIKPEDRDPYMDETLAAFPYVNGGLFSDENIEIPQFDDEIRALLINKACNNFDWSNISPTIFGAVFESTLNPETRDEGGMHYTSIENIHKVIDTLFLNDLIEELATIKEIKVLKTRKVKLYEFQDKLSKLKFLDPACGSGNFLTETYLSLRRLENEVLKTLTQHQMYYYGEQKSPIKVSIRQFYGMEVNDFAVTVARTALWIAESQTMKETEDIVIMELEFLPLKSYANIYECNALQTDWNEIIPSHDLNYIIGNPPFKGARKMTVSQKADTYYVIEEQSKNSQRYVNYS